MVTRQDLRPGDQAAQSCHAAFLFSYEHPALMEPWHRESSYLVVLAVADLDALLSIEARLEAEGLVCSGYHEPDFADELTALAVAPDPRAARMLSSVPLALKERVDAVI